MSALLHVLLSLDALRSNHGAWNFSSCLFSLTVVLINIFLRSPQATPGCSWKAKANSRSGFLLFAIIVCEKCNHSFLCSDLCMNTLTNFSQLQHPSCTLLEELYFDTATSRCITKKNSEGLKNVDGVHQAVLFCFFNPFKSAFLGLHLKWKPRKQRGEYSLLSHRAPSCTTEQPQISFNPSLISL